MAIRTRHPLWGLQGRVAFALAVTTATVALGQSGFSGWQGREAEIEAILRHGEILLMEQIGRGVTDPHRVTLLYEGQRARAVWKPLPFRRQDGVRESWAAEVAAYRLSRHLGIDRVPPTVVRKVGSQKGSLQLWVEGVSAFVDVSGQQPPVDVWPAEIARMRAFDLLIDNYDRNQGNFLVDEQWRLVWIDHSRALSFDHHRGKLPEMPRRFDRATVERLGALDETTLRALIGDLVPRSTLRGILRQRDLILEEVAAGLKQFGNWVYLD